MQYITNPRTCAFRGFRGAAGAFRFLPPVVAPCNLKKMQTLAKERSRIDNIRKVVRRREHTELEAGRDASGPTAEVEDAHSAVTVARLDEPPHFPMDGFVGGGLRLELVSSFDCVIVSRWCLAAGKVVKFPTSSIFSAAIFSDFAAIFRLWDCLRPAQRARPRPPVWAQVILSDPLVFVHVYLWKREKSPY
jgi:hypothetical protein